MKTDQNDQWQERIGRFSLLLTAGVMLGIFVWAGVPGTAEAGKYANTNNPYWRVGNYDKRLSNACRRKIFNQVRVQHFNIGYLGDKGTGITGIAMQHWNLRDPMGLAEPDVSYHFYNDGYSDCRVYSARLK